MNLTLKGFLRGYCRELTGLETDSLKKLLDVVLTDAPAAAEALMAFAASRGKADYLARLAVGTRLEGPYREAASEIESASSLEEYLSKEDAPERYSKVWFAYLAKKNSVEADRRVISLMRQKTLDAIKESPLTIYGLCRQLGLNRGNVYAYLNGGDVTKVSRATARRIMMAVTER